LRLIIKYRVVIAVLAATLIPTVLFLYSINSQLTGISSEAASERLEMLRTEKSRQIVSYYSFVKSYLEEFSRGFHGGYELRSTVELERGEAELGITGLLLLDEEFRPIKARGAVVQESIERLKGLIIGRDFHIDDFRVSDEGSTQTVFHRSMIGNTKRYAIAEIDSSRISGILRNEYADIDIYNKAFQIISSTREDREAKTDITALSKRILDGNTSTEVFGEEMVSYGVVDLGEAVLFINIYIPQSTTTVIAGNARRFALFIGALSLLLACFLGIREYLARKREGSGPFESAKRLDELEASLDSTLENLDSLFRNGRRLKSRIDSVKADLESGKDDVK